VNFVIVTFSSLDVPMGHTFAGGRNNSGRDKSRPYIEKRTVVEFFAWSFFPLPNDKPLQLSMTSTPNPQ